MGNPVTEAMIESYVLMILVMATFFIYFCVMVWAFSNPKVGATEGATGERQADAGASAADTICMQELGDWLSSAGSVRFSFCDSVSDSASHGFKEIVL